jgi:MFS family permease
VASAALLPLGAQAADRFGPRRTLAAAWAVFAVGSAACAVVPAVGWLVAARAVQGAGSAVAVASARRLHGRSGPDGDPDGVPGGGAEPAAAPSPWASPAARAVLGLALLGGPLIVGAWTAGPGWRWYFASDAVVGAAAGLATAVRTREAAGVRRRLDVEGTLASALGLTAVVWALGRTGVVGWQAPDVVVALTAGVLALSLVVKWLMPMGALHRRVFLAGNTAEVFFFASVSGPVYAVSWDLQGAYALGALGTGLRLTMWTAVTAWPLAFRVPLRGPVSPRAGRVAGLSMHGAGLAALALMARDGVQRPAAMVPLAVSGVGVGLALAAMRGVTSARNRPGRSEQPGEPGQPGRSEQSGHRGRPGRPGAAVGIVGAVSLAGAVLGVAYPSAVFPALGVATGARHAALASVLRWGAVLAAAAAAATLAAPTRAPGFRPVPEADPPGPRRPPGDSGHSDGPPGPAPAVDGPAARPAVPPKAVASAVGVAGSVKPSTAGGPARDMPFAAAGPAPRNRAGLRLVPTDPADPPRRDAGEPDGPPVPRPCLTLVPPAD